MNRSFFCFVACALLVVAVGCSPKAESTATSPQTPTAAPAGDGHDHGEAGMHGGHLLHLEPTGAHAEWTHDEDSHQIAVYLDDFDAAKIEAVKFLVKIGDKTEEFPLEMGDESWTITSEALMTHIDMGEAVAVSLVVVTDGAEQSTKIEQHEHHHH